MGTRFTYLGGTKCFDSVKITSLVEKYGWGVVKDVAILCAQIELNYLEERHSLQAFEGAIDMLISLTHLASEDMQLKALCEVVAKAFVEEIEKQPLCSRSHYGYGASHSTTSLLLNGGVTSDKAFGFLFKFGNADLLVRLELWVASYTLLSC